MAYCQRNKVKFERPACGIMSLKYSTLTSMINDELQSKRFRWIQPCANEDERSRADQGAKNFTILEQD